MQRSRPPLPPSFLCLFVPESRWRCPWSDPYRSYTDYPRRSIRRNFPSIPIHQAWRCDRDRRTWPLSEHSIHGLGVLWQLATDQPRSETPSGFYDAHIQAEGARSRLSTRTLDLFLPEKAAWRQLGPWKCRVATSVSTRLGRRRRRCCPVRHTLYEKARVEQWHGRGRTKMASRCKILRLAGEILAKIVAREAGALELWTSEKLM